MTVFIANIFYSEECQLSIGQIILSIQPKTKIMILP